MMLQAWELGLGSTWGMLFNHFKMREAFGIPENIEPVALLVMGYLAPDAAPNERHTIYRSMKKQFVTISSDEKQFTKAETLRC